MSILHSIILGLVQGLTEFLPVSSSGHLAIFKHVLGIENTHGNLFDILLHIGTLVAVCMVFKKDINHILLEVCRMFLDVISNIKLWFYNKKTNEGKRYIKLLNNNYRKLIVLIVIATIPTFVIGYLLQPMLQKVSNTLITPGIGFLITAVLLLVVDYVPLGKKKPKDTGTAAAFLIGVAQGFAVIPGVSRFGVTLSSSLLSGFNRKFAIKFSFLMSIPAIVGATIYELLHLQVKGLTFALGGSYVIGAVVACVIGIICIKAMIRIIEKYRLRIFAIYCFVIGMITIIVNFI